MSFRIPRPSRSTMPDSRNAAYMALCCQSCRLPISKRPSSAYSLLRTCMRHLSMQHFGISLTPHALSFYPDPPSLAILALNTNCETPTAMAVCCPPGCLTVPQLELLTILRWVCCMYPHIPLMSVVRDLQAQLVPFPGHSPNCAIAWLSIPVGLVASPQLCSDAHRGEQHHQQRLQGAARLPAPCQRVPRHPPPRLRQLLLCPLPALDCTCSMHCRADRGIPRKAMYHCRVQDDAGVLISHNTGILDARMPMPMPIDVCAA